MGHEIASDRTGGNENDLIRLLDAGTASDAPTVGAGLVPPAPVAARASAIFKGGLISLNEQLDFRFQLDNARDRIEALLEKGPCNDLFGDPNQPDMIQPLELLDDLIKGGKYGNIKYRSEINPWGQVRGHGWNGSGASSVTIDINAGYGYGLWRENAPDTRAEGLLHELGHANWWLFGASSTRIQYDHSDLSAPGTSTDNDNLIWLNCFGRSGATP